MLTPRKEQLGTARILIVAVVLVLVGIVSWQSIARRNAVPAGLELVPPTVPLFAVASSLVPVLHSPLVTGNDLFGQIARANVSSNWTLVFGLQCGRDRLTPTDLSAAGVKLDQPAAALFVDPYTIVFAVPVSDHQAFADYLFATFRTLLVDLRSEEDVRTYEVRDAAFDGVTICTDAGETFYTPGSVVGEDDTVSVRIDDRSGTFHISCAGIINNEINDELGAEVGDEMTVVEIAEDDGSAEDLPIAPSYAACQCRVGNQSCDSALTLTVDVPAVEVGGVYPVEGDQSFDIRYAAIGQQLGAVVVRLKSEPSDSARLADVEPVLAAITQRDNLLRFTGDHTFWAALRALGEGKTRSSDDAAVFATLASSAGGYPRTSIVDMVFRPSSASGRVLLPIPEPGSRFYRRLLEERRDQGASQLLSASSPVWGSLNDLALSSYVDFFRRYQPEQWEQSMNEAPAPVAALAAALQPDDGLHNLDVQMVTGSDGVPGLLIAGRFETIQAAGIAETYLVDIATELHVVSAARDIHDALVAAVKEGSTCDEALGSLSERRQAIYRTVLGAPEFGCSEDGTIDLDETSRADGYSAELLPVPDTPGAVYLSPALTSEEIDLMSGSESIDRDGLEADRYRTVARLQGSQLLIADRTQILQDAIDDASGTDAPTRRGQKGEAVFDLEHARNLQPIYPQGLAAEMDDLLKRYSKYALARVYLGSRRDLASLLVSADFEYSVYERN